MSRPSGLHGLSQEKSRNRIIRFLGRMIKPKTSIGARTVGSRFRGTSGSDPRTGFSHWHPIRFSLGSAGMREGPPPAP